MSALLRANLVKALADEGLTPTQQETLADELMAMATQAAKEIRQLRETP